MEIVKPAPRRLRWYAVRCDSSRTVIRASVGIARLNVPVFIPMHYKMVKKGRQWVPEQDGFLFPPYLFVAMRANGDFASIRDVDGVDRVMGYRTADNGRVPVAIPYRVMRAIRTRDREPKPQKVEPKFKKGETVRIMEGPFTSFDGIFDRCEKDRVKILVSLFGRQTEVELEETDIRAA